MTKIFLTNLISSKTITFNAIMLAALGAGVAYLNMQGIPVTQDDILRLISLIGGVITPIGNIILRFFTKKPLAEKTSFMD